MDAMLLQKFTAFLSTVDLQAYRERYRPIKIVEMDLPKNIQAISLMYVLYWDERSFLDFDAFYEEYTHRLKNELEEFRKKIFMCKDCFYLGLPARIYRTWASIITQIHAGYVAESVFGKGSVTMSEELDHKGADFVVSYKGHVLNYQVKKESFSREVRKQKQVKNNIPGEFVDILYKVPPQAVFEDPKTKKGVFRKPYLDFVANTNLKRLPNGFVVFTQDVFSTKKRIIDSQK